MAIERNPSTTKNAVLLLKGAGRGVISEHGAQMAIDLLENNGFQIWEMAPDPPVEPAPAPKPVPEFASKESLREHYRELRELEDKVVETRRSFMQEFDEALWNLNPVLEAIRMAMENKEVPQNGGEEG